MMYNGSMNKKNREQKKKIVHFFIVFLSDELMV